MKVFMGWDPREEVAYSVAEFSIHKHNKSIEVIPLKQEDLRLSGDYYREKDPRASTEFTITRFLVPHLCDYKGYALFVDCDVILQSNIEGVLNGVIDDNAVNCVKHNYSPSTNLKMDKQVQFKYPRKNWSSVMLFNCAHPLVKTNLTCENVNTKDTAYLHRMIWAEDKIGALSHTWNYLAGYYNDLDTPDLIHYTDGGPWFKEYEDCELSNIWKTVNNEFARV